MKDQFMSNSDLENYHKSNKILFRNMFFIVLGNIGFNIGLGVSGALSIIHMKKCGVSESFIGGMAAVNFWMVSILVMYFSWRSDHTLSRWGRRVPYAFVAMFFIATTMGLFPHFTNHVSLIILYGVQYLFVDMKGSTWSLIMLDCVRRDVLGRMLAINVVVNGTVGFFVIRYGMRLAETNESLVFLLGAMAVIVLTSLALIGVREPPVRYPSASAFRPLTVLRVGFGDKRMIVLMMGAAMINSFILMWGQWNVLWASSGDFGGLGLSKTELGDSLSYGQLMAVLVAVPCGVIVDKFKGFRIAIFYFLFQAGSFLFIYFLANGSYGFLFSILMMSMYGGLYSGIDMMIWKRARPDNVGSVTSCNGFVRNMYYGIASLLGGIVVVSGGTACGGYGGVFLFAILASAFGLFLLFLYAQLMAVEGGKK